LGPGAIVRVDDMTDPNEPIAIWTGRDIAPSNQARIFALQLKETREMDTIRIVVDTRLTRGWEELDAIGLIPSR
jgi:hypothetical protein